jgi:hypothetical protein
VPAERHTITPSAEHNTLERVAPGEFIVQKILGKKAVSNSYQVRDIPDMYEADLAELYRDGTTSIEDQPIPLKFIPQSEGGKEFEGTVTRDDKGKYNLIRKDDEGTAWISGVSENDLRPIHKLFTHDFEYEDSPSSTLYMGYDKDGNPEVIEIGEVGLDNLE